MQAPRPRMRDKAILPESMEQPPEQDLENLRQSTATGGKHPQGLLLGGQPGKTQLVGAEPRLPRREAAAAGLGAGVANAWVTAGGAWVPAQRRVRGWGGRSQQTSGDKRSSARSRAVSEWQADTQGGQPHAGITLFPEACPFLFHFGCVESPAPLLPFFLWQRSLLSQLPQICLWALATSTALGHRVLGELSGWRAWQLQLGARLKSSRLSRPGVGCGWVCGVRQAGRASVFLIVSRGPLPLSSPPRERLHAAATGLNLLRQGPDPAVFSPKAHPLSMSAHSEHGEGNGNPLQYSCLENSFDRGAWWAAVHGVAQSRTRLK